MTLAQWLLAALVVGVVIVVGAWIRRWWQIRNGDNEKWPS